MATEHITSELVQALIKAQQEIHHAEKDATNPAYRAEYASLQSVIDAVKKPLNNNGLYFTQLVDLSSNTSAVLVTRIIHSSGGFLQSIVPLHLGENNKRNAMQELGTAISYARRYALAAICGLTQVDIDGNTSDQNKTPRIEKYNSCVKTEPSFENFSAPPIGSKKPETSLPDNAGAQESHRSKEEIIKIYNDALKRGNWTKEQSITYLKFLYGVDKLGALSNKDFDHYIKNILAFSYAEVMEAKDE